MEKKYNIGDTVLIDDEWKVINITEVTTNAPAIGDYTYSVYTLCNETTTIMLPEWLIHHKSYRNEDDSAIDMVAKVEYTKGYNQGYYDAYEKIIRQLMCDNQVNKQIKDMPE